MRTAFIVSNKDIASENFKNVIIKNFNWKEKIEKDNIIIYKFDKNFSLYEIKDKELIFADNIDKYTDEDVLIFLSRHVSSKGINGFYVHAIGNFTEKTDFGGRGKHLCYTSAFLIKNIFKSLIQRCANIYDMKIGLEITHHGPYVEKKPCVFVEIGSEESRWRNEELASVVIKVVMSSLSLDANYKAAIAIGGSHYAPAFLKYQAEEEFAIGHIMPSYVLEEGIDYEIIDQMPLKTIEKVNHALIDWKGLRGEHRRKIIERIEQLGLEVIKV